MYFSLLIKGTPFVGHDANDHNLLLKGAPIYNAIASAMQFSKSLQQHWEQESERKTPNYCIADEQCLKHQEVSRNEPEERVRHHHPQNGSRVTSRTRGGVSRDK